MFAAKSWPSWPMPTPPVLHTRYVPVNPEDFYWDPRYHTDEGDPDLNFTARWAKPTGNMVEYQILESLQGKEKQSVLKLAESFETLIRDGRSIVVSTPLTAYQRFLVYCCSVYYGLAFAVVPSTHEIYSVRTASSRIPQRRISDMAPPELTTANLLLVTTRYEVHDEISKTRLISRLVEKEKKRETGNFHANSAPIPASGAAVREGDYIGRGGEEISTRQAADEYTPSRDRRFGNSDAERQTPNEEDKGHVFLDLEGKEQHREDGNSGLNSTPTTLSGAVMGERNATPERDLGSTSIELPKRRYLSMAERQAAYEEARSRIFMDFEEKSEAAKGNRKAKNEGQIKDGKKQEDGSSPSRSTPDPGSAFGTVINNSRGLGETNGLSSTSELESPNAQALTSNTQSKYSSIRSVLFTMVDQVSASAVTGSLDKSEESNNEEDMSESASVSGTIYSYASSRTKSTDYGFYYRRMALSQESLLEGPSMLSWRHAGVE